MKKIIFEATFTEEQIEQFALANGYQSQVETFTEVEGEAPQSVLSDNPETAAEFALRLGKQQLVEFLSAPSKKLLKQQKVAEFEAELSQVQQGVQQAVIGEIEEAL